jgi:glutamyl-tRNA reductase
VAGELVVVGLSHRTAPVALRERLAFAPDAVEPALRALLATTGVSEALLLSTCNRVEIHAVAAADPDAARDAIVAALVARGVAPEELAPHLVHRRGEEAVRHLFRVAAALDSMVVGEAQILGQLKRAHAAAVAAGGLGARLGRALERAFRVAKRVRSETAIARGAANVASVAVDLAAGIFGDLHGAVVLVIGAGKMSDLATRHLAEAGAAQVLVTNRSPAAAEILAARVGGRAHPLAELDALLARADVVLASTGSPRPIVTRASVRAALRARKRPLFLIDLGVPRDIEPACADLDGAYLFDIDDLERVVTENLTERRRAAAAAEAIVAEETAAFTAWLRAQDAVPTIRALRDRAAAVAHAEAERTVAALGDRLGEREREAVRRLADSIVAKLLHAPSTALRAGDAEAGALVAATRRLFALDDPPPPPEGKGT